jgi:hypothetical protein
MEMNVSLMDSNAVPDMNIGETMEEFQQPGELKPKKPKSPRYVLLCLDCVIFLLFLITFSGEDI